MPKRKRQSPTYMRAKRRRYKKRVKARYSRAANLTRTINVPNRALVKLKYCDSITITGNTTAGLAKNVYYRCNGVFDPQYSAGGHQPLGYDEWAPKFHHWKVIGSKIIIKATASKATYAGNYPSLALTRVNTVSGDATTVDPNTLREQKGTKFVPIEAESRGSYKCSMGYSNKKTYGSMGNTANHYGSISADPAEGAYWRVSNVPSADSEIPNTLYLQITIYYTVMFVERVAQGGS